MILYNIKIALLNLKSKFLITIGSLLTLVFGGICIVLLLSYVYNELSMNKFHERERDIYITVSKVTPQSDWRPIDLSHFLRFDYTAHPEVENVTSVSKFREGEFLINANHKTLGPSGIFTDSTFFEILDFELLSGNKTDISNPDAIFITQRLSKKFFGDVNPIGESVTISGRVKQTMTIAGILENPKSNSSLSFDFIIKHKQKYSKTGVDFILFKKGVDKNHFVEKIKNIGKDHPQFTESEMNIVPFRDIYFNHSNDRFNHHFSKSGNLKNIYILLACIILLFIISVLNFSNLQLIGVNSSPKKNEIFMANGANQLHLSVHLILESIIISVASIIFILFGVYVLLPYFNQLVNTNLFLDITYILILSFVIITSQVVVALFFPLSIINKNPKRRQNIKALGQKKLVVFQFILLVFFLVSSIVTTKQIDLLLNKDLGFNYSSVIQTKMFDEIPFIKNREEAFKKLAEYKDNLKHVKDQLQSSPHIISFSQGDSPINPYSAPWKIQEEGQDYTTESMLIVNPNHAKVFNFEIIQGRFFNDELDKSREDKVVINEAALKFWNIDNLKNTILKNRYWQKGDYEIIGIIKDYNFEHLSAKPKPLVMLYFYDFESDFFIKLNEKNIKEGLQFVENVFHQYNPDKTFKYSFVSEQIQNIYAGEKRLRLVYILFTIVSILIACLGLFTVALFDTKKKTKEIGVRKVNGAKTYEIMRLLNKDFLKLVIVALIIALPISYYAMNKWLENFAYKTELSWWIFALAGIIALGIALLTVSWQSWKAAKRNPVESLRYE